MSDAPPRISYAAEVRRKALHLGALVLPLGVLVLGRETALWLLVPTAAVAVAGDWLRVRSPVARRWIQTLFGPLMRPEEIPPLGGPVVFNGATTMIVAVALCTALFPEAVAAAAIAMQQLGDAAAALVGRKWGRHQWPRTEKSVEGSMAFVAVALAAGLAVHQWPGAVLPLAAVGIGAVVAAAVEAAPIALNDNFRVPLATGLAMMAVVL